MASVFHYTDASGLLGILSSESLFATDYRYLNDLTEGAIIQTHIMPIFEAEIAKITQQLIEKKFLKEEYYMEQGKQGDLLQATKLYDSFIRIFDSVSPFFVLSFCGHQPDSYEYQHGLLSQWRGYADGGGFAIEFDESKLDELAKAEVNKFAYAGFKSANVAYKDFDKVFNSVDYQGIAGEMIWQLFDAFGKDVTKITGRKNVDEAVVKFAQTAPFIKHLGFYEEAEYRFVMTCLRASKKPEGWDRPTKEIKFRNKRNSVIPYIELFDTITDELPIKAVIIGPHPHQKQQEEAVRMALESWGFEASVRSSEIPYRG